MKSYLVISMIVRVWIIRVLVVLGGCVNGINHWILKQLCSCELQRKPLLTCINTYAAQNGAQHMSVIRNHRGSHWFTRRWSNRTRFPFHRESTRIC